MSREISTRTAPGIAVSATLPRQLVSGDRPAQLSKKKGTNTAILGAVLRSSRAEKNTTMSDASQGQQGLLFAQIHVRFLLMFCSPWDTNVPLLHPSLIFK